MKRFRLLPLLLLVLCALAGCTAQGSGTRMDFSFSPADAAKQSVTQTLYVGQGMDPITLAGNVRIDAGEVTLEIVDPQDGEVLWSAIYGESAPVMLDAGPVKAEGEYLLRGGGRRDTAAKLTLTSEYSYVRPKAQPTKPIIE